MNNFFDLTLANIRQGIKEANLDPIQLPHDADKFTVKVIYNIYMEASEPKLVNFILDIIGVNSLRPGVFQM